LGCVAGTNEENIIFLFSLFISYTEDEGSPFEVGFQEQASNYFKLLWSKAMMVSVEEKLVYNLTGRDQRD
jgi:hypothetical protein